MTELADEIGEIYDQARNEYEKIAPKLRELERDCGYAVLYGPPIKNPPLLIVGLNPGGRARWVPSSEPPWPHECEYATAGWKLAKKLQTAFGRPDLLRCTGVNVVFLAAPEWKDYQAIRSVAAEMERFSVKATKRIIRLLEPERLLILGIKAPELLLGKTDWWKRDGAEWKPTLWSPEKPDRWLLHPVEVEGTEGWVTQHLSGAHGLHSADPEAIGAEVRKWVKFQPPA